VTTSTPFPAPIRVRRRRAADEEFILRLGPGRSQSIPSTHGGHGPPGASWHDLDRHRDQLPVGLVTVEWGAGEDLAYLSAIAVVDQERGRGVGRKLLDQAEREARRSGARGLRLHTANSNVAALELFLKRGFRIHCRWPRFYLGKYDACELVKTW